MLQAHGSGTASYASLGCGEVPLGYGHGRSYGVRGVEVRLRRTQIRRGNSVRGGGRCEVFSRKGVHRGRRPTVVRSVYALAYSIPEG